MTVGVHPNRQKLRSEETKQAILTAAGRLFADRGYDAVSMREIATAAGCSHTAIYIHFADKEALLHHLALGPLQSLQQQLTAVVQDTALTRSTKIKQFCWTFIRFCLQNRSMYNVLFMAKASRIDGAEPALEIQKLRNQMFDLFRQVLQSFLPPGTAAELALAQVRICFYTLHGIIGLYSDGPDTYEQVMQRLAPTFDLALDVLLAGFDQTAQRRAETQ
jgi:AcrR family transcriptional regulator